MRPARRAPLLTMLAGSAALAASGAAAAFTASAFAAFGADAAAAVSVATPAVAAPVREAATLRVVDAAGARTLARAALLADPAVRTIEISADAAYGRPMRYRALPLSAVLRLPAPGAALRFTALDGFAASIPAELLAGAAEPWLAVEPADAPWPALKPGKPGAGPFYLVWRQPARGPVSPEQWPYQVAAIEVVAPLASRFPQWQPQAGVAEQRGLQVFATHCAACHRLNGGGDAAIGPDLNVPANPTEYFHESYLRRLIRDPASVRQWPQRTMPGFAPAVLDDGALDDLLAYLRRMAALRPAAR